MNPSSPPPPLPNLLLQKNNWQVVDSGPLGGESNMEIDRRTLQQMDSGQTKSPVLRFFEWSSPCISYGYLLNEEKVRDWSHLNGNLPLIKRPTGGGAVLHQTTDLSLSLLWPRHQGILPENPRDAYKAIHERILE